MWMREIMGLGSRIYNKRFCNCFLAQIVLWCMDRKCCCFYPPLAHYSLFSLLLLLLRKFLKYWTMTWLARGKKIQRPHWTQHHTPSTIQKVLKGEKEREWPQKYWIWIYTTTNIATEHPSIHGSMPSLEQGMRVCGINFDCSAINILVSHDENEQPPQSRGHGLEAVNGHCMSV